MYEYRLLSRKERAQLVAQRLARGFPPHSPPHPVRDRNLYLLTSACYEHLHHMKSPTRRQQLLDELYEALTLNDVDIRAWVVLTNHYHLLVRVPDFESLGNLFRLVNGRTARDWNLQDGCKGRKVWYRYMDRAIRNKSHYYATLNYIHYNPVKHAQTSSPFEWEASSIHWYLERFGRDWLRDAWLEYPVRDYGGDWDSY